MEYVAERIRQDRAEAAQHEQLVAELEAAGITVTDGLPDGAARLAGLVHDGEDLTPETHAGCPGRGAYFQSWNLEHPVHYCASPGRARARGADLRASAARRQERGRGRGPGRGGSLAVSRMTRRLLMCRRIRIGGW